MMRLENSREAGLLSSSTPYSSLEMSKADFEFDVPLSRQPRGKRRCYCAGVCFALIVVAAIVGASVVTEKKNAKKPDDSKNPDVRSEHQTSAPAPTPVSTDTRYLPSAPPGPSVETPEPVESPVPVGAAPVPVYGPSAYSPSYDLAAYGTICNQTVNPEVCLNVFTSNPNAPKVDLQQWTIMTMEAAEQALNESYKLALGMKDANAGSVSLQQCIEVFANGLDNVNTSMYLVADMSLHHPGNTGTDVQTYMSAAMTDQETCQEGIDDVGGWPGSDLITGQRAEHVNTLLSISLTFVDKLTASTTDPSHHRRLLHIKPMAPRIILGRRDLLSFRVSQRLCSLLQAKAFF